MSINGSHTISNSFVDSTINSNEFGGLIYEINTNNLIDNLVVVQQCYYTAGEATVVKIDNVGYLLEDKVDNANEGFKPGWKYSAKYEDACEWCDYKYLEGSNKLIFNYRIQSGFVKVYLTGSHYESVVVTSDGKPFDASNLSLAFKEADKHAEAEINLLVEKVFMGAEAKLENATDIKINALKDTTIVRGEGNKGGMFSGTAESKISIGSSSLARSETNATITLDGGVEDPEKSSEEVGALVVSYGGDVEIGENVVIQNNVNNTIGYGGAVLVYNPENQPVIEASIENCYAEHAGGAICVIGKAPKSVGSIKNCSTSGKGGAIAVLSSMDNSSSRKAMNALYANDKTISFMNDHTDVGENDPDDPNPEDYDTNKLTLTGGVDSFENCSAAIGGAIYLALTGTLEFSYGEGYVSVNKFTDTTDKAAGRVVFRNNTAEFGGAIFIEASNRGDVYVFSIDYAYFEADEYYDIPFL